MRLSTAILCLALLCSCTGNRLHPAQPSGTAAPPALELERELQDEFTRLGIDPDRVAAGVPTGSENSVFDLVATPVDPDGAGPGLPTAVELSWTERLAGDFNQDGMVIVTDLTPVGQNWESAIAYDNPATHGGITQWPAGDPDGDGAANWRLSRIDGNGDGLVYLSDISVIAQHWKEQLDGYVIQRAVNYGLGVMAWETVALDIGHGNNPSAPRALATAGTDQPVRYSVTIPLNDPQYSRQYRILPHDGVTGQLGLVSPPVTYYPDPAVDTVPPVWSNTVGVTAVQPGDGYLAVYFGQARDVRSEPVSYRVYWAEGDPDDPAAPFDYATALFADTEASPYQINSITGGTYYRVAVRAADSADPPNREANTAVLGRQIGSGDIYPPHWDGPAGIQSLAFGDGVAIVSWGRAVDSFDDGVTVWESGPVVYRIYYGPGTMPEFGSAQFVDYADTGLDVCVAPVTGLDTTKAHWFVVRARDQAEFANEDPNLVTLTGHGLLETDLSLATPGPGVPAAFNRLRAARVLPGPDSASTKLACVWRGAVATDSWLSSWWIVDGGLVHDVDVFLPHEHVEFMPLDWRLDTAGNHCLIYRSRSELGVGDAITTYDQATAAVTEVLFDGEYIQRAGFDLELEPWVLSYIDNGIELPYTYFDNYFSFVPVDTPLVFYQSTPAAPHYSYDYHSVVYYTDGTVEVCASDNAQLGERRRLRHRNGVVEFLAGHPLCADATELNSAWGRDVIYPVLVYECGDLAEDGFIRFCQDDLTWDCDYGPVFYFVEDYWKPEDVRSIDRLLFHVSPTTAAWHAQPEVPLTFTTANLVDAGVEQRIPVSASLAAPGASIESMALLGDGRAAWVWRDNSGNPQWFLHLAGLN